MKLPYKVHDFYKSMKQKHFFLEMIFERDRKANKTYERNIFDFFTFLPLHPVEPVERFKLLNCFHVKITWIFYAVGYDYIETCISKNSPIWFKSALIVKSTSCWNKFLSFVHSNNIHSKQMFERLTTIAIRVH